MIDNTCIHEIDWLIYHHDVDWIYHTGRTSLKISEIDEWINMVEHSIALDFQLDDLRGKMNEAEENFNKVMDEQRKLEDQIHIWGRWRRMVDDT